MSTAPLNSAPQEADRGEPDPVILQDVIPESQKQAAFRHPIHSSSFLPPAGPLINLSESGPPAVDGAGTTRIIGLAGHYHEGKSPVVNRAPD